MIQKNILALIFTKCLLMATATEDNTWSLKKLFLYCVIGIINWINWVKKPIFNYQTK